MQPAFKQRLVVAKRCQLVFRHQSEAKPVSCYQLCCSPRRTSDLIYTLSVFSSMTFTGNQRKQGGLSYHHPPPPVPPHHLKRMEQELWRCVCRQPRPERTICFDSGGFFFLPPSCLVLKSVCTGLLRTVQLYNNKFPGGFVCLDPMQGGEQGDKMLDVTV